MGKAYADQKFRVPRIWSNEELRKVAPLVSGKIVNISAWRDEDKEGSHYKDYFSGGTEYWVTNFESSARGFQGNMENEIFVDLTKALDINLVDAFDVAFNHTVLEHVFDVHTAFSNICRMTKDLAIIVVPFMQEEHGDYGDFWRFTPQAMDQLFRLNGMGTVYLSYNEDSNASIYVFCVASKYPERWFQIRSLPGNKIDYSLNGSAKPGVGVIRNSLLRRIGKKISGG